MDWSTTRLASKNRIGILGCPQHQTRRWSPRTNRSHWSPCIFVLATRWLCDSNVKFRTTSDSRNLFRGTKRRRSSLSSNTAAKTTVIIPRPRARNFEGMKEFGIDRSICSRAKLGTSLLRKEATPGAAPAKQLPILNVRGAQAGPSKQGGFDGSLSLRPVERRQQTARHGAIKLELRKGIDTVMIRGH